MRLPKLFAHKDRTKEALRRLTYTNPLQPIREHQIKKYERLVTIWWASHELDKTLHGSNPVRTAYTQAQHAVNAFVELAKNPDLTYSISVESYQKLTRKWQVIKTQHAQLRAQRILRFSLPDLTQIANMFAISPYIEYTINRQQYNFGRYAKATEMQHIQCVWEDAEKARRVMLVPPCFVEAPSFTGCLMHNVLGASIASVLREFADTRTVHLCDCVDVTYTGLATAEDWQRHGLIYINQLQLAQNTLLRSLGTGVVGHEIFAAFGVQELAQLVDTLYDHDSECPHNTVICCRADQAHGALIAQALLCRHGQEPTVDQFNENGQRITLLLYWFDILVKYSDIYQRILAQDDLSGIRKNVQKFFDILVEPSAVEEQILRLPKTQKYLRNFPMVLGQVPEAVREHFCQHLQTRDCSKLFPLLGYKILEQQDNFFSRLLFARYFIILNLPLNAEQQAAITGLLFSVAEQFATQGFICFDAINETYLEIINLIILSQGARLNDALVSTNPIEQLQQETAKLVRTFFGLPDEDFNPENVKRYRDFLPHLIKHKLKEFQANVPPEDMSSRWKEIEQLERSLEHQQSLRIRFPRSFFLKLHANYRMVRDHCCNFADIVTQDEFYGEVGRVYDLQFFATQEIVDSVNAAVARKLDIEGTSWDNTMACKAGKKKMKLFNQYLTSHNGITSQYLKDYIAAVLVQGSRFKIDGKNRIINFTLYVWPLVNATLSEIILRNHSSAMYLQNDPAFRSHIQYMPQDKYVHIFFREKTFRRDLMTERKTEIGRAEYFINLYEDPSRLPEFSYELYLTDPDMIRELGVYINQADISQLPLEERRLIVFNQILRDRDGRSSVALLRNTELIASLDLTQKFMAKN